MIPKSWENTASGLSGGLCALLFGSSSGKADKASEELESPLSVCIICMSIPGFKSRENGSPG